MVDNTARVAGDAAFVAAYHRHDVSDRAWNILPPLLPGGSGKVGRPAQDNRRFIKAAFRVLCIGAPWRNLPPDYGAGCDVHRRFSGWHQKGIWAEPLQAVIDEPDLEWLLLCVVIWIVLVILQQDVYKVVGVFVSLIVLDSVGAVRIVGG